MPFFSGASDFQIGGGQFTDVAGNYTNNDSSTKTENKDSNNTTTTTSTDSYNDSSTRKTSNNQGKSTKPKQNKKPAGKWDITQIDVLSGIMALS